MRNTCPRSGLHSMKILGLFTLVATQCWAQPAPPDDLARTVYERERAACSSKPLEEQTACLREAAAALQESTRGVIEPTVEPGTMEYQQNATARCQPLPEPDRLDCMRRMQGGGVATGSV